MLKKAGLTQYPGTSPPLSKMSTRLQLPCPRTPEHRVVAGGFPVLPGQGGGRGLGLHLAGSTRAGEDGCHQ